MYITRIYKHTDFKRGYKFIINKIHCHTLDVKTLENLCHTTHSSHLISHKGQYILLTNYTLKVIFSLRWMHARKEAIKAEYMHTAGLRKRTLSLTALLIPWRNKTWWLITQDNKQRVKNNVFYFILLSLLLLFWPNLFSGMMLKSQFKSQSRETCNMSITVKRNAL